MYLRDERFSFYHLYSKMWLVLLDFDERRIHAVVIKVHVMNQLDKLISFLLEFLREWNLYLCCFCKIGQVCRPLFKRLGFWESTKELGRLYEYIMGLVLFMPIAILSWFPFVSEFQTRLLFNQAFSRGLQISMILAGRKDKPTSPPK